MFNLAHWSRRIQIVHRKEDGQVGNGRTEISKLIAHDELSSPRNLPHVHVSVTMTAVRSFCTPRRPTGTLGQSSIDGGESDRRRVPSRRHGCAVKLPSGCPTARSPAVRKGWNGRRLVRSRASRMRVEGLRLFAAYCKRLLGRCSLSIAGVGSFVDTQL